MRTSTLLLLISLVASISGSRAAIAEDPRVEDGRQLAEALCAACHIKGNTAEKTVSGSVPAFQAIAQRPGQSADGIVAWLRSAPPMMPNHHLTYDEADKLAAYILSLRTK